MLSKYNLFVQELKIYRIANHITFLRGVPWSGMEDKNFFGHVLKCWKQNRMAWRVNYFLDTQEHHGPFVALLASVTLQSIHNGTNVKTKNMMI